MNSFLRSTESADNNLYNERNKMIKGVITLAEHVFHLTADWPGLRNDVGTIDAGNLKTEVSIPPEMDGKVSEQILTKCYSEQLRLVISSRLRQ